MTSTPSEQIAQAPEGRTAGRRLHVLAILVLAAVMYYLLDTATDEEVLDISRLLDLSEQDYDYFMANVDTIHYTADGRADYRFRASRVTHYPNPGYSLMEAPRFLIYRDDESAWRIDAASGRVEMDTSRNQERLILTENVIIIGITAEGRPVNITTESATVYPNDRTLDTDSAVTVESEGFISSSIGLSADLNTNVIRQLANGQLHYEPSRQPQ